MSSKIRRIFPILGGEVTSGKGFIGKTKKIDPFGIFSEHIFGPINNYCCSCGHYNSKILYGNEVCPKCGVICAQNDLRYEVFGKIGLTFPIFKPSKKDKILKIIGHNKNSKALLNPKLADYLSSTLRYINVRFDRTGISIINELIYDESSVTIPFRITGLYSLYIVLMFIHKYLNVPSVSELFENEYITHTLKVLPPNLRMVSFDSITNKMRSPKINRYYTILLNYEKVNKKLKKNIITDEKDWIDETFGVIDNEKSYELLETIYSSRTNKK